MPVFSPRRYYSGDGDFLRRYRANFAGLLEYKRQYLWFNGLYLLRFVLADAGRYPADAENGLTDAPDAQLLGAYLGLWGVFTLFMFFGTLKAARALQFVFLSLTVLFALLAVGNITGNEATIHIAGWVGLVCGASAIYLAMGEVLNEQFGRTILPIGEAH